MSNDYSKPFSDDVTETRSRIVVTRASAITPCPTEWVWRDDEGNGWLPRGMLCLIAGRESAGKSGLVVDRAARLTRGQLKGCYYGRPKSVIFAATEDSWSHTLVPRLIAAGADLDRVLRVHVEYQDLGTCELSFPDDVPGVKDVILQNEVVLLVLDPFISRLSRKLDTHKDGEVRQSLEPLAKVADETGVVVLGIIHVSKAVTRDPLTAVMGSRAFSAVPRVVLFALQEPQDRTKRVLSLSKNNLGPDEAAGVPSLAYQVEGAEVETPTGPASTSRVVWCGTADRGAREILAGGEAEPSSTRESAEEFLLAILAGGPVESETIRSEAREAGISPATLRRAKDSLSVRATKHGGEFGGIGARWYWELPNGSGLTRCSTPPQDAHQKAEHLVGHVSTLRETAPVSAPACEVMVENTKVAAPADRVYHHLGSIYRVGDTLPSGSVVVAIDEDGLVETRKVRPAAEGAAP